MENLDTFSVSMTVSFTNDRIRRSEIVNLANGLLRHRFGYAPRTRDLYRSVLFRQSRDAKALSRQRLGQTPTQRASSD